MTASFIRGSSGLCLLLALLILKGWSFPVREEAPALLFSGPKCLISLGDGFDLKGIHQINDACTWGAVINLADSVTLTSWLAEHPESSPPRSGEHYEIIQKTTQKQGLSRSWLPAGQRMALHVPLHPDQMEQLDWQSLPGIGSRLAEKIDLDRQINGDFVVFDQLRRVEGIGQGHLKKWRDFF